MSPTVFLLGLAAVLSVAAIGVSLFAVWRTQASLDAVNARTCVQNEETAALLAGLQKTVDGQATLLEDLQRQYQSVPAPGMPRAGLNISKRSQILRLHRKGDAADRIAAELDVPQQEVELLLKVHRIVLASL